MAQVDSPKETKRIVIDLAMTVEEARKVIWQGSGPREPMGSLLDSNQISYRDLAWAVDKAYSPQVRSAALTLLASWLGKPDTLETTRRFGPKVIEASHYLEDQELDGMAYFIGYMVGGLFLIVILLSNIVQFLIRPSSIPLPLFIGVNLIVFVAVGFWILRQTRREFNKWKYSRQGRLGEDKVVESLRTSLDSYWTIIRNLQLPGNRKDDIDIGLVGPGGVWAVEVKAYSGTVRCQNDRWERQRGGKWETLKDGNPSSQAKANAARLKDYLSRQGVNLNWVEAVVTLAEPQPTANFKSDNVTFWFLPTLDKQTDNLIGRRLSSEDQLNQAKELLADLAQKQIVAEEAKYKKRSAR